ncbi:MAG: GxxExxY protein [Acidobacteria bacterium]|nr:MAG: GxxExxY protein [Acidobacteriota bacterium]
MRNHGEHGEETTLKDCDERLIDTVLTAVTTVHRRLGPGLFESVYELATMVELEEMTIPARRQVEIPVLYRGRDLGIGFRADIIVANCLLLEFKTIDEFSPVHLAQVITYLKLLRFKRGFLINFNKTLLKDGIKRVSI